MRFGLFYFADSGTGENGSERYDLLRTGAQFADSSGFTAIWTPERHFHSFGGLYPNPSVTGAALAAMTDQISIRAGSVVAPLHHPLRIAEEWSVVDNLSGGRAGISFASGWHPVDFALRPEAFADRKATLTSTVDLVRQLWRGEEVDINDGAGKPARVRIYPQPIQPELPVWITSSGSVETFRMAGAAGTGLLTHLLGQDLEALAPKIAEYRRSSAEASNGSHSGYVVLMIHAFLDDDRERARDVVREPLCAYLRSSFGLIAGSLLGDQQIDPATISESVVDFLVRRSFDRYFDTSGLFGDLDMAKATVARLNAIGVDELACLIDFGVEAHLVLDGLSRLAVLRDAVADTSIA
jgi:natural product biosynthesis luciferase-like monooxygenase protein